MERLLASLPIANLCEWFCCSETNLFEVSGFKLYSFMYFWSCASSFPAVYGLVGHLKWCNRVFQNQQQTKQEFFWNSNWEKSTGITMQFT